MEILNTPAAVTTETVRRDRNGRTIRTPSRPQQLQRSRRGRRHGKGCGELTGAIGGDHAFRRPAEALGRPGLLARNQPRAHSLSWLVHAKLYLSEPTCDSRSLPSASHSQATQGGARDPKDTLHGFIDLDFLQPGQCSSFEFRQRTSQAIFLKCSSRTRS